jgi:glucan phosphoethanolaminetransferase (alkaline phosphatase superfamily)
MPALANRPGQNSPRLNRLIAATVALGLTALAFALFNEQQLIHGVLYRLAAHDPRSAAINFGALAIQGGLLFAAIACLPRRWFGLVFSLAALSAAVVMGYQQVLHDRLDTASLAWMIGERREANAALATFAMPIVIAGAQWLGAIIAILAARRLTIGWRQRAIAPLALIVLVVAFAFAHLPGLALGYDTVGSERALYVFGARLILAEPPPERAKVELVPERATKLRHIVWLVDESIAHDAYARLVAPSLAPYDPIDFGEAASMANCSAPSNVALRAGVDIANVSSATDLRATPSIWGYARRAGFATTLIDGQVTGAPQNLLLDPERALIDDYRPSAAGLDTDRAIARKINRRITRPGKSFTYAILAGAHFQYRDHYPSDALPADAPLTAQYDAAVGYSKRDFFKTLLAGVDRNAVAIFYTSDHGQNVQGHVPPHCSTAPVHAEYSVPLVALLPNDATAVFSAARATGHDHSQIFPTTLWLMGYPRGAVEAKYDRLLDRQTKRYVTFGRAVVPTTTDDTIDVSVSPRFPGR